MNRRLLIVLLLTIVASGCGNGARRAPALGEAPPIRPEPPRRNLLREAGDTTWKVVTAPARLVTPAPKPKRVAQEPIEPPAAVIIRRTYDDEVAPATQPAR